MTWHKVYDLVWRFDFTAPGFCLLDLGAGVDSHMLRARMLDLKASLSEANLRRGCPPFRVRSLARFDQHVIVAPNETERRRVNSLMLVTQGSEELSAAKQEEFVTTDEISQKIY